MIVNHGIHRIHGKGLKSLGFTFRTIRAVGGSKKRLLKMIVNHGIHRVHGKSLKSFRASLPCNPYLQWFKKRGYTKKRFKMELLLKDETYKIRGVAFDVYHEMGCGFLEAVYQECMEKELQSKNIPFISQPRLKLSYKNEPLEQTYKPDLICFNQIIVELKATKGIAPEHKAQIINYLKATKLKVGLLINFGSFPKVQIERFVL